MNLIVSQSRSPPILPPSLTVSNFPALPSNANAVPSVVHVLSHILPTLSMLPLSLAVLNATPFTPESKDENLFSGWLQLPKGSVCVVTEGGVTEGVVSERGPFEGPYLVTAFSDSLNRT